MQVESIAVRLAMCVTKGEAKAVEVKVGSLTGKAMGANLMD